LFSGESDLLHAIVTLPLLSLAELISKLPKLSQQQVVRSLTKQERSRLMALLSRKQGVGASTAASPTVTPYFDEDPTDEFFVVPQQYLRRASDISAQEYAVHKRKSRRKDAPACLPFLITTPLELDAGMPHKPSGFSLEDSTDPSSHLLAVIQRMMLAFGDVQTCRGEALVDSSVSTLSCPSLYSAMRIQQELVSWLQDVFAALPPSLIQQQRALVKLFPLQSRSYLKFNNLLKQQKTVAGVPQGKPVDLATAEADTQKIDTEMEATATPSRKRKAASTSVADDKRQRSGTTNEHPATLLQHGEADSSVIDSHHSQHDSADASDSASAHSDSDSDSSDSSDSDDAAEMTGSFDANNELEQAIQAEIPATGTDATAVAPESSAAFDIHFPQLDCYLGSHARLQRQNALSARLSPADYIFYTQCRTTSFGLPASRLVKFLQWLDVSPSALSKPALQLLCYIARDRVGMIVELCQALRQCSRHSRSEINFTVYEVEQAIRFLNEHPHTTQIHLHRIPSSVQEASPAAASSAAAAASSNVIPASADSDVDSSSATPASSRSRFKPEVKARLDSICVALNWKFLWKDPQIQQLAAEAHLTANQIRGYMQNHKPAELKKNQPAKFKLHQSKQKQRVEAWQKTRQKKLHHRTNEKRTLRNAKDPRSGSNLCRIRSRRLDLPLIDVALNSTNRIRDMKF
jgi:hypothetical protein